MKGDDEDFGTGARIEGLRRRGEICWGPPDLLVLSGLCLTQRLTLLHALHSDRLDW